MKGVLLLFVANIVCSLSLLVAGCLAYEGKEGWGWFLFVAVLLACVPKSSSDKDTKEEANDQSS